MSNKTPKRGMPECADGFQESFDPHETFDSPTKFTIAEISLEDPQVIVDITVKDGGRVIYSCNPGRIIVVVSKDGTIAVAWDEL